MVASGTWTDPLAGATYLFGQRLPSSDMNYWIAAIRSIDESRVANALSSFRSVTTTSAIVDGVWDQKYARLVCVGSGGGAPKVELIGSLVAVTVSPTAGDLQSLSTIATDNNGTLVAGGFVGAASAAKVRTSTDGGLTWTNRSFSVSNDHDVRAIYYFSSQSIYVAFLGNGTGTATIQSSPDGTTWTARTNPDTHDDWKSGFRGGVADDGTTMAVLYNEGVSTNKLIYSTNGTTFSTATLTATTGWGGIAYTESFGWVVYSFDLATINESDDGVTWSAAATATAPTGALNIKGIASVGNVLVMSWDDASADTYLGYSTDGGATWTKVASDTTSLLDGVARTNGRIVWLGASGTGRALISGSV